MPSSGSTTQRSPLLPFASPPSSPRMPSSGRAAARRSRISRSAAWSASETRSVGLDLAVTFTSGPANASRSCRPASRATDSAISRNAITAPASGPPIRSRPRAAPPAPSSVGSPSRGATSCTASGKPSGVKPGRDRRRRLPGVVVGRAVRDEADRAAEDDRRRPPLVLADRRRAAREHRREHEVDPGGPQLLAVGARRPPWRARPPTSGSRRRCAGSRGSGATAARGAEARGRSRRSRADSARRRR